MCYINSCIFYGCFRTSQASAVDLCLSIDHLEIAHESAFAKKISFCSTVVIYMHILWMFMNDVGLRFIHRRHQKWHTWINIVFKSYRLNMHGSNPDVMYF